MRSPTCASRPEISLELRHPHDFSIRFVAIEISLWRCTELLPEVSPLFACAVTIVGEVSPTYASRPEVSPEFHPPRELSLGFIVIEVSLWCCTELLSEVSPVFACIMTIIGEVSPTYPSHSEVSVRLRHPREFSLGFVAIEVSLWRCMEYYTRGLSSVCLAATTIREVSPTYASLLEVSPELRSPCEFSPGFVAIEASLALYRTTTRGLSSICLCRGYCWEGFSHVR